MSSFLFLAFPHVLRCDTVQRQMGVVKQKPSIAHRTGWCLPLAVTTFLPRGGTGTTAGSTACRTTLTWSLSTAHRSRSFFMGKSPILKCIFLTESHFNFSSFLFFGGAEISFWLRCSSMGWYDWQRGRRKVDLGRWNTSKRWAVRCLGREGRVCLYLMFYSDRNLLVPDNEGDSKRMNS